MITYTIIDGFKVVKLLSKAGFKRVQLIGSLGRGRTSQHDIDILIPLKSTYDETILVDLFLALNPVTVTETDWGGLYFEGTPYGTIDIFFSKTGFTY